MKSNFNLISQSRAAVAQSPHKACVAGSNPASGTIWRHSGTGLTRRPFKPEIPGSSPGVVTIEVRAILKAQTATRFYE